MSEDGQYQGGWQEHAVMVMTVVIIFLALTVLFRLLRL